MTEIIVKGKVEVFPKNRERLTKKKKPFEEQTIVVNVSNDIGKLYRYFLYKEKGVLLEPPSFQCHVTLNNGKLPFNKDKYKKYLKKLNGSSIKLKLNINLYRHWEFFALSVDGYELNKIREDLELPLKDDFHITIGRLHPSIKALGILTKELI